MQTINAEEFTSRLLNQPVNEALQALTESGMASVVAGITNDEGDNGGIVVLINRAQFQANYIELIANINQLLAKSQDQLVRH